MRVGIEEISKSKMIGIPAIHINTFMNTANKTNHIISFRSVSPLAYQFLKAGHPTKSHHVKNKSCQNGPAAGLIPVNPIYSRATTLSDYATYQTQINDAKKWDPTLIEGELILSATRIKELMHLKRQLMAITYEPKDHRYQFSWQKQDKRMIAYATWQHQHQGYHVTDESGQAMLVMGHMINEAFLPITTDYDLLMLGFKRNEWHPELDQHNSSLQEQNNEPCKRSEYMIKMINQDIFENDPIRQQTIAPIVHHDQEAHNPSIDDNTNDDFPCLFILPNSISGILNIHEKEINLADINNKVLLIENLKELQKLYKVLTNQQNDFYLPIHPKYQK